MNDRKSLGIFSDEQRAVLLLLLSVHSFIRGWVQTKTLVPVISVRSYVTLDLTLSIEKYAY